MPQPPAPPPPAPISEIVVPMPAEDVPPPAPPAPPAKVVTETAPPEPPAKIAETQPTEPEPPEKVAETATKPEAPPTTTTQEPSRRKETAKKIGAVFGTLLLGAVIAHQTRGHNDHNADRRIDVSPRSLTVQGNSKLNTDTGFRNAFQGRASIVTVTNVGKDDVTIGSIEFAGRGANQFRQQNNCGKLAPNQKCQISVLLADQAINVRATLIVNSNGGRGTVDLVTPQYTDHKP